MEFRENEKKKNRIYFSLVVFLVFNLSSMIRRICTLFARQGATFRPGVWPVERLNVRNIRAEFIGSDVAIDTGKKEILLLPGVPRARLYFAVSCGLGLVKATIVVRGWFSHAWGLDGPALRKAPEDGRVLVCITRGWRYLMGTSYKNKLATRNPRGPWARPRAQILVYM